MLLLCLFSMLLLRNIFLKEIAQQMLDKFDILAFDHIYFMHMLTHYNVFVVHNGVEK